VDDSQLFEPRFILIRQKEMEILKVRGLRIMIMIVTIETVRMCDHSAVQTRQARSFDEEPRHDPDHVLNIHIFLHSASITSSCEALNSRDIHYASRATEDAPV
jgi:hypothetical protein